MKAYETFKFEQYPDVGDIQREGRKSSAGRFPSKNGRDYRPLVKSARRVKVRRRLKRADKARAAKIWMSE